VLDDFLFRYVDGRLTLEEDELRLLYVAFTRAQHVLDVSALREILLRLRASSGQGAR
jgi:superfamily I DNA/RNA helicase